MSVQFNDFKLALKIIYSSESAVLDVIYRTVPQKQMIAVPASSPFGAPSQVTHHSPFGAHSYTTQYVSEEKFPCTISTDSLGDVDIEIFKTYISFKYKNIHYRIEKKRIVSNGFVVDISDIESKDDMFSLSTVRDFAELTYADVERALHIYNSFIPAADKARNA